MMRIPLLITFTLILLVQACVSDPLPQPGQTGQLILNDDSRYVDPRTFNHSGNGIYISPEGIRYEGRFENGLLHGHGTREAKGSIYTGNWHHGQRSGKGKYTETTGAEYEGFWQSDKRHGPGVQAYADGATFEGTFISDIREGFGRYTARNGTSFEGAWLNDQREGYGFERHFTGVVYEGMWSGDVKEGLGQESLPSGTRFRGEWQNGLKHGIGSEIHGDGSSHHGTWSQGLILGMGERTNSAGIKFNGAWTRDLISSGLVTFPSNIEYAGQIFKDRGKTVRPQFLSWLEQHAAAGDPHAQYFLGLCFLDYQAPAREPKTAAVWLSSAAAQGIAHAQYRLATLIREENFAAALDLLHSAAKNHHGMANAVLGEYYHTGQQVPHHLTQAVAYYEAAIIKGIPSAKNNLAWLLATTESELANPARAIRIIQPLAVYSGYWQHLDTLAAAHARLGHFKLAIDIQQQAIIGLQRMRPEPSDLMIAIKARLNGYQQKKPYLE